MGMYRMTLPVPVEMLAQIDARRGEDVDRTVWIRRAITNRLTLHCPVPGCEFSSMADAFCTVHGRRVEERS